MIPLTLACAALLLTLVETELMHHKVQRLVNTPTIPDIADVPLVYDMEGQ